jgi:hypothetical protein
VRKDDGSKEETGTTQQRSSGISIGSRIWYLSVSKDIFAQKIFKKIFITMTNILRLRP